MLKMGSKMRKGLGKYLEMMTILTKIMIITMKAMKLMMIYLNKRKKHIRYRIIQIRTITIITVSQK